MWNELLIALGGTGVGGLIVKLLITYYNSKQRSTKMEYDVATEIRKELRTEVSTLRKDLRAVEIDLDAWKAKYYALLEAYNDVKHRTSILELGVLKVIRGEITKAELDRYLPTLLNASKPAPANPQPPSNS